MIYEPCKWKDLDAIRCLTAKHELTVLVAAGPRIISLKASGYGNLLYEDTLDFRVGEWRIYGGHRLTTAPESDASYEPDNDPCRVETAADKLTIHAAERTTGIVLTMVITEAQEGFTVEHIIQNEGRSTWEGALWAITCIPRTAQVSAPCDQSDLTFWPGTDPSNWMEENGTLTFAQGTYTGKVGWHATKPGFKVLQEQGDFSISSDDVSRSEQCTDSGSNLELYANSHFIEVETLSKQLAVHPGETASHHQKWTIHPPSI